MRSAAVGDDDVSPMIAIEVGESDVARRPVRLAERAGLLEVAVPVVEGDPLRVGAVVAHCQVQVAIPIQIRQGGRVTAIRSGVQRMPVVEVAVAVVEQDQVVQRPVPAFRQDDVRITVAIQVADAGVRRGFSNVLEKHGPIEIGAVRQRFLRRFASQTLAPGKQHKRDNQPPATACPDGAREAIRMFMRRPLFVRARPASSKCRRFSRLSGQWCRDIPREACSLPIGQCAQGLPSKTGPARSVPLSPLSLSATFPLVSRAASSPRGRSALFPACLPRSR